LLVLRERMTPQDDVDAIEARVVAQLDAATEFARTSAWPDPATALDHMYTTTYPGLPARGVE
jgi:TPP-dependent pyruvate/acetoin dehydrogenase alpha subunit